MPKFYMHHDTNELWYNAGKYFRPLREGAASAKVMNKTGGL